MFCFKAWYNQFKSQLNNTLSTLAITAGFVRRLGAFTWHLKNKTRVQLR